MESHPTNTLREDGPLSTCPFARAPHSPRWEGSDPSPSHHPPPPPHLEGLLGWCERAHPGLPARPQRKEPLVAMPHSACHLHAQGRAHQKERPGENPMVVCELTFIVFILALQGKVWGPEGDIVA